MREPPARCLFVHAGGIERPTRHAANDNRFAVVSADPTVEAVYDGQDLNRYSYVLNDPLSLTEPTGYGGFFNSTMFRAIAGIAAAALMEYELLPLIEGTSFAALMGATAPSAAATAPAAAASATTTLAVNSGIAGGVSGAISTGSLKGAR